MLQRVDADNDGRARCQIAGQHADRTVIGVVSIFLMQRMGVTSGAVGLSLVLRCAMVVNGQGNSEQKLQQHN